MDVEEYVGFAVGLASGALELPDDIEDQIAAMGLEPSLRDRTLLLIDQTRMLADRASGQARQSARLRTSARRETTPDERDDLLARRETVADARDDTIEQRESTAGAREREVDEREQAAVATDAQQRERGEALDVRATALDELASTRLGQLLSAIDRGLHAARQAVDPVGAMVSFEEEVREAVADELEQAVSELVEQAMHRWVSHAHHELRQPLAVITGVAETLEVHHDQLDDATLTTLVARLRRQSLLLQRIIDQLARATLLRSGPPDIAARQVDLRPLLEQVRGDYEALLDGAAVTIEGPDQPAIACVEPAAAAEILLVLLRNAIDHAPCDQPILIEVVPGASTVRVSVHDDGPGVPPASRDVIFNYGTRLNSAGSLGLGLFIARQLAEAHGGRLTVDDSRRLGGARFDLTIPIDCPTSADEQP